MPKVPEEEPIAALMPRQNPGRRRRAWVEEVGNAVYHVNWRGSAGRFLLSVTDAAGTHCAGSPFAVLIVPPAGGPASARLHGEGARAAVADEWGHFLLRPSEFIGCEPGPCEKSRKLFDRLHVEIVPRAISSCGRTQSPGGRAQSQQQMPQPDISDDPRADRTDRASVTLSPMRSKSGTRRVQSNDDAHSEVTMGSAVFMEKHFGDGARPKGTGPKYSRSRSSPPPTLTPPPEVEPGAHLIRFKVKTAGDYMLHVRYGQIELSGSPYPLHVFPSLLCVERCRVVGLNDKTGEVKAGEEVSGALLLADKCGNPVVPGPHVLGIPMRVTVEPIGPALDPCVAEQGLPKTLDLEAKASELYPTFAANAQASIAPPLARASHSAYVSRPYRDGVGSQHEAAAALWLLPATRAPSRSRIQPCATSKTCPI